MDDVQWCPYLVRHILQEGHLLLTCRLCQVISALQLAVALLGLLVGLLKTGDLFCQRLLHGGETVLQLAHEVCPRCAGHGLGEMSGGDTVRLADELV